MRKRLLAAMLMLAGCASGSLEPEAAHPLAGTFTWTVSEGGVAYMQRTAETEGYVAWLVFSGSTVRAYRNGQLVGTSHFTVTENAQVESPLPVYEVHFEPPLTALKFAPFEDETVRITGKMGIALDDGCCDRYVHLFSKPGVR